MLLRRRLLVIAAAITLLATAIEYGLIAGAPTESVATGGTIIVEN
jgi:hypothetical protein